jgi:hypothetical protein
METGSRREIVFSEGLRFTSLLRLAAGQSMYCVESAVAQNLRSSSSFLNSGIFFIVFPDPRFIPVHISGGNYAYQLPSDGKCDEQAPTGGCVPECIVSFFFLRMAQVAAYYERLAKEDVFGFFRRNTVPLPVLERVGFVPVKPNALLEGIRCRHDLSI